MQQSESLVPMSGKLLDAIIDLRVQVQVDYMLSRFAQHPSAEDAEQICRRVSLGMWRDSLPVDVAPRLSDHQICRADVLRDLADDCLENAGRREEVTEAFFRHIGTQWVEETLRWCLHPMRLPGRDEMVLPELLDLFLLLGRQHGVKTSAGRNPKRNESVLAKSEVSSRGDTWSRLVQSKRARERLHDDLHREWKLLGIDQPEVAHAIESLARDNPFFGGYLLGSMKRNRGRPRGPTVVVTTRVWTVDSLAHLCDLALTNSLEVWNCWFEQHALDDVHQFAQEKSRVAAYVRRTVGVWDDLCRFFSRFDLSPALEAWTRDMTDKGGVSFSDKNRRFSSFDCPGENP